MPLNSTSKRALHAAVSRAAVIQEAIDAMQECIEADEEAMDMLRAFGTEPPGTDITSITERLRKARDGLKAIQ